MKNSKKGFTLVELLVVIAILAILATVAVVGYTSFTRKADISNDTVIAGELNTLLAATDVTDPIESFEDVKAALYANGFYLANLNTKTEGCYFVWDAKNNQIILVDGNDDFKVLFSKVTPSEDKKDWYFAVSDLSKVAAIEAAGYTVERIVTDFATLKDALTAGGEFHIDRSLVLDENNLLVFNSTTPIVFNLGDSPLNTSGIIGESASGIIPIEVKQGNVTLNGGVISAAGENLNYHGLKVAYALQTSTGTDVTVVGTKFDLASYEAQIRIFGKAVMEDVVINAVKSGVETRYNGDLTLKDVTITANGGTEWYGSCLWSCSFDSKNESGKQDHVGTATITVESGTYTSKACNGGFAAVVACGGKVVINGGDFTAPEGQMFTCVNGGDGKITIAGGTFNGIAFENLTVDILQAMTVQGTVSWDADLNCYIIQ